MIQLRSHVLQQLRINSRDLAYMFTSIFLPAGLYWFFAVPESSAPFPARFMTGSFCAFSFFGVIFLQYAINTSQERESSWSLYLGTLPISYTTMIVSRFITSVVLGILACGLIFICSKLFTPSDLTVLDFSKMILYLSIGSVPLLLMGLVTGKSFRPKAVVPVANFLHLVLSFAGGLWKPPEILPKALQPITPWLPTYHYGQLAWSFSAPDQVLKWSNIIYLGVFGLVMLGLFLFLPARK